MHQAELKLMHQAELQRYALNDVRAANTTVIDPTTNRKFNVVSQRTKKINFLFFLKNGE